MLRHSRRGWPREHDDVYRPPADLEDALEQYVAFGRHGIGPGVLVGPERMHLREPSAAVVARAVLDPVTGSNVAGPILRTVWSAGHPSSMAARMRFG
jgi:hypothetical protein